MLVRHDLKVDEWSPRSGRELLRSGASGRPGYARRVPPILARLADQREGDLASRASSSGTTWQAQDELVQIAFDHRDAREADEAVARREARVVELEDELRALGVGTSDTDSEGEQEAVARLEARVRRLEEELRALRVEKSVGVEAEATTGGGASGSKDEGGSG